VQVVDANVLLYAVNEQAPHHAPARAWLNDTFTKRRTIGFAWVVLLAFLRLSTQPGIFPRPLEPDTAAGAVEQWLAQPSAVVLESGDRHLALLTELLKKVGTAGNLVNDAHLAALALEYRAEVVSFDGDFARFEGVSWHQPA
jgi:hypothetical protein